MRGGARAPALSPWLTRQLTWKGVGGAGWGGQPRLRGWRRRRSRGPPPGAGHRPRRATMRSGRGSRASGTLAAGARARAGRAYGGVCTGGESLFGFGSETRCGRGGGVLPPRASPWRDEWGRGGDVGLLGAPGVGVPSRASYLGKLENLQEEGEARAADPCQGRGDRGHGEQGEVSPLPCALERRPEIRAARSGVLDALPPAAAPRGAETWDCGAVGRRQRRHLAVPAATRRARGQRRAGGGGGGRETGGSARAGCGEWAGHARPSSSETAGATFLQT